MGNACAPQALDNQVRGPGRSIGGSSNSDDGRSSNKSGNKRPGSFRSQMFLSHPTDRNVFHYYDIIEVIGEGSISTIYGVRRKPKADLATLTSNFMRHLMRKRNDFAALEGMNRAKRLKMSSHLSLEQKEHVYALKAINKDSVNELFLSEMRNEVSILKVRTAEETCSNREYLFREGHLCHATSMSNASSSVLICASILFSISTIQTLSEYLKVTSTNDKSI
jgi:serine/threonine protein kinase